MNRLPSEQIDAHIDELESATGHAISKIYREWLHRYDLVSLEGCYFIPAAELFRHQLDRLPRGWINVANDGCGDYFALVTTSEFGLPEPVVFLDAYEPVENCYIVASDFSHFVEGQLLDNPEIFHWPFDREQTLQIDPDLVLARNVRLPWDDE